MLFSDKKNPVYTNIGLLQNETNSLNMFCIEVPDLGVRRDLCSDP